MTTDGDYFWLVLVGSLLTIIPAYLVGLVVGTERERDRVEAERVRRG